MARKKRPEEHVNHDRWLVSYADFITLLFAFFVVMYSMSSVNEGKYRILADSMSAAFSPTTRSLSPIQIGELVRAPPSNIPVIMEMPQPINIIPVILSRPSQIPRLQEAEQENENDPALEGTTPQIEEIANDVGESFKELIDEGQITLRKTPLWLEVEINSNILFNSGRAELSATAEEILSELGVLLSKYPNRINVEGFTDNQPIQSTVYPSNWELSSARAAAVVRLFEDYGIEPMKMVSVGYGEFRPTADNNSEEGRAANRKVIVVVMADIQAGGPDGPFNDIEVFRQRISN